MIEVDSVVGVPAIAQVIIVVPGPIVPLNRTYLPSKRTGSDGKSHASIASTAAGKAYKAKIHERAWYALRSNASWPPDPWRPTHVRLSTYACNSRTDAGAANKLCADALQGVLYVDDEVVSWGESPRPKQDGGEPRLIILAELLAMDDAETAKKRRESTEAARAKRALAKIRRGR